MDFLAMITGSEKHPQASFLCSHNPLRAVLEALEALQFSHEPLHLAAASDRENCHITIAPVTVWIMVSFSQNEQTLV